MEHAIRCSSLGLSFTSIDKDAYDRADVVIVATPTDYDSRIGGINTESVEAVVKRAIEICPRALFVIRSTVPAGFSEGLQGRFSVERLIFCPEFLREGRALHDSYHPSRIVVGGDRGQCELFGRILCNAIGKSDVPLLFTGMAEAEAIKLFSNSYLAMRVAFFNELDTFGVANGLNVQDMIKGVSLDPRIGNGYNNPSFGYGGYCLPKDTKQLLASYRGVPQRLFRAIVEANEMRKQFVAKHIAGSGASVIGFYRLVMKSGSDNIRSSSVLDVLDLLLKNGADVIVYEPVVSVGSSALPDKVELIRDIELFKKRADLIVANRVGAELHDVLHKVYTRDQFNSD